MNKKKSIILILIFALITIIVSIFAFNNVEKTYTVHAYEAPSNYSLNVSNISNLTENQSYGGITSLGNNEYSINSAAGFITLARISQSSSLEGYTFYILAADLLTLDVNLTSSGAVDPETSFCGIGKYNSNSAYRKAFSGTIIIGGNGSTYLDIPNYSSLFNCISTKAEIRSLDSGKYLVASSNSYINFARYIMAEEAGTFNISGYKHNSTKYTGTTDSGFVANVVDGNTSFDLDLTNFFSTNEYNISTTSGYVGGLFGKSMANIPLITLKLPETLNISATGVNYSGLLVGYSYGNITINESGNETSISGAINVGSTNYGVGLFGYAETTSTITINGTLNLEIDAKGFYAGGVVGYLNGTLIVDTVNITNSKVAGSIANANVGGLIGYIKSTGKLTIKTALDIDGLSIEGKGYLGGVVGYFNVGTTRTQEINHVSLIDLEFNPSSSDIKCCGGIIGYYKVSNANSALIIKLENETYNIAYNNVTGRCGGVAGYGQVAAQTSTFKVYASSSATINNTFKTLSTATYCGGLVAEIQGGLGYSEFSNFVINNNFNQINDGYAGDIFSYINTANNTTKVNNTVKINNITYKRTSNHSSLAICEVRSGGVLGIGGNFKDLSNSQRNIVRKITDALVFADEGFNYTHPSTINGNDIGNYGQILRNDTLDIIEFDSTTNQFVVSSKLNYSSGTVNISSIQDFAKLYIYYITNKMFNTLDGTPSGNFDEKIVLNCDIDLTNIGIESMFPTSLASISRAFSGELVGNNHTITLDIGKNLSSSANKILHSDANNRRCFGLFTIVKNAKFSNLTIYNSFENASTYNGANHFYGSVCALVGEYDSTGSSTFVVDNVTANVNISNLTTSTSKVYYYGGIVGYIKSTSCLIDNCTVDFTLTNKYHEIRYGCLFGTAVLGNEASLSNNMISGTFDGSGYPSTKDNVYAGGLCAEMSFDTYTVVDFSKTCLEDITLNSRASGTMGGLLGYTISNCEIALTTPIKNCTITSTSTAKFGGLAYNYKGKLILDKSSDNSTEFKYENCNFTSTRTSRNSLMIYNGPEAYVACRLTTAIFNGLVYQNKAISSMGSIDLFIVSSISAKSTKASIGKTGGFVTFETLGRTYGNNCGTYADAEAQNWLTLINTSNYRNSGTRYYFNVEELEDYNYNSNITDERDLMYFSVSSYLCSSLRSTYFKKTVTAIYSNVDINMTGRIFYPGLVSSIDINFNNHTFTINTNSFNYDVSNQFRGLGTGIILEARAASSGATVNVKNMICAGSLRYHSSTGGFVICDVISGTKVNDATIYRISVNINNIYFNNLQCKTGNISGLLIGAMDSYADVRIDTITQYSISTYNTANKTNTYSKTQVFGSLIGDCGLGNKDSTTPTSTSVNVTLSNIIFDGKKTTSIFKNATLFNSIYYVSGTASFRYNFNLEDDHKNGSYLNNATYGKELVLNEEQQKYYDSDTIYVSSTSGKTTLDSTIQDNYLFYVYYKENYGGSISTTDSYCLILSVNRKSVDMIQGFGTFTNPYVIDSAKQLLLISEIISNKDCALSTDWRINYPSSSTNYNAYVEYAYNGTDLLNGSTELSRDDLQSYLQGAYYYLKGTLEMSTQFIGLGTAANPFHGVIVGANNAKIEMGGKTGIASEGYGLVNVANGCAVYNITIEYIDTLQMTTTDFSTTTLVSAGPTSSLALSSSPYFGGVIGYVCGGDNLIDGVKVTFNGFNQTGASYCAAGGYVGVITSGGVAFNNLKSTGITDFNSDSLAHFYYNPYVGKVTNGYAISMDNTYDNTSKYYNIVKLNSTSITGTYTSNSASFNVSDANQLLILSYALNNGSLAYNASQVSYGLNAKNRISGIGDYAYVNVSGNDKVDSNGKHSTDTFTFSKIYLRSYFDSSLTSSNISTYNISINLTGSSYDMSIYHNGFRGISGQFVSSIKYKIKNVSGTSSNDMKVDMNLGSYYNGSLAEKDAACFYGLIGCTPVDISFSNISIEGCVASRLYTYSNNTITAITSGKFTASNANDNDTTVAYMSVGALLGLSKTGSVYSNISISNMDIISGDTAGGLTGVLYTASSVASTYLVTDTVSIDNANISGFRFVGGAFGLFANGQNFNYEFNGISINNSEIIIDALTAVYGDSAVGGIIGRHVVRGSKNSATLNFNDCNVIDSAIIYSSGIASNKSSKYSAGGIISNTVLPTNITNTNVLGCVVGASTNHANIANTSAIDYTTINDLSITDTRFNKIQGIVSYLAKGTNNTTSYYYGDASGFIALSTKAISFTNCNFGDTENYASVVYGLNNAGGFFGEHSGDGTITMNGCNITSNYHRVIIISHTRAGGLGAYQAVGKAVNITNCKVIGTETSKINIISAYYKTSGSGAVMGGSVANATTTVDGLEVAYTNISSPYASVICPVSNSIMNINNAYLHDNYVQSTLYSAGGITASNLANTYVNSSIMTNNFIVCKSLGAGLLAGVNATKSIYANYLMVKDNELGLRSTALTHINVINDIEALRTTSINSEKAGYLIYNNSGIVQVMGLSRLEQDSPLFSGPNVKTNTGTAYVVNIAYNSLDNFLNVYNTDDEITVKEAMEMIRYEESTDDYYGDHMYDPYIFNGLDYRENNIDSSDLSEMVSTINDELDSGKTVNKNFNLLVIQGSCDEYLTSYIEYLISESISDISSTDISITSVKYYINSDGTFNITTEKGSVYYENGKFFAGKYDNLEADTPTFTMLTITFKNKSNESTYITYSMKIAIYYPQVLSLETRIIPIDSENYSISAFIDRLNNNQNPYTISVSSGDTFTLYVNYYYNSIASQIEEYNFDKFIHSTDIDSRVNDGKVFPSGTKFLLIDLNSSLPSGYKVYYYTLSTSKAKIEFNSFSDGSGNSYPGCQKYLNELSKSGERYLETYLIVVEFPQSSTSIETSDQYYIKAGVGENDKNIIVDESNKSKLARVDIWKNPTLNLEMEKDLSNNDKTISLSEKYISEDISVSVAFPSLYIQSLSESTKMYGIFTFQVKNNIDTVMKLPSNTVIRIYDDETLIDTLTDVKTYSYSIGDIISKMRAQTGNTFTYNLHVELDFSSADPLEFSQTFNNNENYYFVSTFYYSASEKYYNTGEFKFASSNYVAVVGDNIKITVNPTVKKELSVNINSIEKADKTNSGIITFDVNADFTSCIDNMPTKAKFNFAIYKKVYNGSKYYYDETNNLLTGDNPLAIILYNGTNCSSSITVNVSDGFGTGSLTLKLLLRDSDGNVLSTIDMANYKLVATVQGLDNNNDIQTTTESNYFIFQICDIMTEPE